MELSIVGVDDNSNFFSKCVYICLPSSSFIIQRVGGVVPAVYSVEKKILKDSMPIFGFIPPDEPKSLLCGQSMEDFYHQMCVHSMDTVSQ